jgi:hypothetical protein
MFSKFKYVLEQITSTLHLPADVLRTSLDPFYLLYQLSNVFDISFIYKLLTVTCEGAKSPIELFIISLALGVAILFVESNYGIIRSVRSTGHEPVDICQLLDIRAGNYFRSASCHHLLDITADFDESVRHDPVDFFCHILLIGAFFAKTNNVSHNISIACLDIAGYESQELLLVEQY